MLKNKRWPQGMLYPLTFKEVNFMFWLRETRFCCSGFESVQKVLRWPRKWAVESYKSLLCLGVNFLPFASQLLTGSQLLGLCSLEPLPLPHTSDQAHCSVRLCESAPSGRGILVIVPTLHAALRASVPANNLVAAKHILTADNITKWYRRIM